MYATVNGFRMAYRERGGGRETALLLIHGFPLDSRLWDAQLAGLSSCARVIAPDLRGSGKSDVPPGPYSVDQYAGDLVGLLDNLSIRRAVVAGLSMGGYIAFALWRRHPELVRALVLADTRAEPDSPQGRANRDASAARVQEIGVAAFAAEMLPRILAPGITVPTLVIVGGEDGLTTPADASAMAGAIPGARLVEVPRAGHLSPLENPRAVNAALREFLRKVAAA
jgi:3-oxoadipate enol-lactonase